MDEYVVALPCRLIGGHFPSVSSLNDACKKESRERHPQTFICNSEARGSDIQVLINLWQTQLAAKQHLGKSFMWNPVIPFSVTILLFS